jgi:hypothetical protein
MTNKTLADTKVVLVECVESAIWGWTHSERNAAGDTVSFNTVDRRIVSRKIAKQLGVSVVIVRRTEATAYFTKKIAGQLAQELAAALPDQARVAACEAELAHLAGIAQREQATGGAL